MKILIGMIGHETNTFSSEIGNLARWGKMISGNGILIKARHEASGYMAGVVAAADEEGVELIPSVELGGASGPLILKEALEAVTEPYLACVRDHASELDGICLCLHGAAVAEGAEDVETYILKKTRDIVGDELPIAVTLDLHGNITEGMTSRAALFGLKEYPHIDSKAIGEKAMHALCDSIRSGKKLRTVLVRLPMHVNPCMACTLEMPMKAFRDYEVEYEKRNGLVDLTIFHGFPYADLPSTGASVTVTGYEGEDLLPHAQKVAEYLWDRRHVLDVEILNAEQAVNRAVEEADKPGAGFVVINEASDNPGGGCPGDGTHLLRELIRQDVPGSIVDFICDPEIAVKAAKAGIGGKVNGLLGGKHDTIHGAPVELKEAVVCALSNGIVTAVAPMGLGSTLDWGITARLRIGNVEVVVVSNLANQTLDDRSMVAVGADPFQYRIVAIKSTNHFRAYFSPRAKAVVTANTPGIHTADYAALSFKRLNRPIYPMDPETTFCGRK